MNIICCLGKDAKEIKKILSTIEFPNDIEVRILNLKENENFVVNGKFDPQELLNNLTKRKNKLS